MKRTLAIFLNCFLISLGLAQSNLQFTTACENISTCLDENCMLIDSKIKIEAVTDCSISSFLIYSYSVDLHNNGFTDFIGSSNEFDFPVELGIHKVIFVVNDQCGEMITCESIVEILDCTAPVGNCIVTSISTSLEPGDTTRTIMINQIPFGITDACTDNDDLIYSLSDTSYVSSITISCTDIFQNTNEVNVNVYISDLSGNQTSCPFLVSVSDFFGNCNLQLFDTIPVCVTTPDLEQLEEVLINEIIPENDSNSDCKLFIPTVGFVSVKPFRATNPFNGITLLDLILLRKHILQILPIDDPYKLIAADINTSGNISGFDVVLLSRAILKIDFNIETSWFFVDADFDLPTTGFDISYPNLIEVSDIDTSSFPLEFIGVKAGDLDCSVDKSEQTNGFLKSPIGAFTFCAEDRVLEIGEEVIIPIKAKDFNEVMGFVLTIKIDSSKLTLKDILPDEIFFILDFFNSIPSQGKYGGLWIDNTFSGITVSEEDTLFNLVFEVSENVLLSDAFTINGSFLELDAYNINDERLEVNFEFCNTVSIEDDLQKALNLDVFPNPFHETAEVRFHLLEGEVVTFTVFDISGRKVKSFTENLQSGQNSFFIEKKDFPSDGIYFFEVKTTENIGVGKLVLN